MEVFRKRRTVVVVALTAFVRVLNHHGTTRFGVTALVLFVIHPRAALRPLGFELPLVSTACRVGRAFCDALGRRRGEIPFFAELVRCAGLFVLPVIPHHIRRAGGAGRGRAAVAAFPAQAAQDGAPFDVLGRTLVFRFVGPCSALGPFAGVVARGVTTFGPRLTVRLARSGLIDAHVGIAFGVVWTLLMDFPIGPMEIIRNDCIPL